MAACASAVGGGAGRRARRRRGAACAGCRAPGLHSVHAGVLTCTAPPLQAGSDRAMPALPLAHCGRAHLPDWGRNCALPVRCLHTVDVQAPCNYRRVDKLTPGRRAAQLRINYARSPLSSQCAPGTPAAGWRAPDVALQPAGGGAPVRVYELMRGTHHTLLAFGEPGDAILAEAAVLQARLGALVRLVTVSGGGGGGGGGVAKPINGASAHHMAAPAPGEQRANGVQANGHAPAAALACTDCFGKARERYGVTEPCAFLIRPDGYIGVARASAEVVADEVSRRFA